MAAFYVYKKIRKYVYTNSQAEDIPKGYGG